MRTRLQLMANAVFSLIGIVAARGILAQSSVSTWEQAAGGRQEFDVASVRQEPSGSAPGGNAPHSNFPLDAGNSYSANGGLFSVTNYRLDSFIGFAYKLSPSEIQTVLPQLPKWAQTDRFDVQGRTDATATKDQMRMMVRSLLQDRFKLQAHQDQKEVSLYTVARVKDGKTGPQLVPHNSSAPCQMPGSQQAATSAGTTDGNQPAVCGVIQTRFADGRLHASAKDVTIEYIASYFPGPSMGNFDRPVVDQTGLVGSFDFRLDWTPETLNLNGAKAALDPNGPTFLEALKDQLGLKLVPTKGLATSLIVDHLEEPWPN